MSGEEKCPICMEVFDQYRKRKIHLETCKHKICFNCIRLLAINNKYEKEWFHKCPLCRENFTKQELQRYNIVYKHEDSAHELDRLVNNIRRINPLMGDVIYTMRNTPNVMEQAQAIDMFFSGNMSYAEMRAIAG